ncbi:MAG: thioesterase family protein [Burkholderiales bacterium]|nr:thioesterase family protein [Burkholderiales bacterium]
MTNIMPRHVVAGNTAATMSDLRRLARVERIPIRWGDMDAMGHVNNTVDFRYMEQARIGWFDRLVPEEDAWRSTGIVIANASCNYRRALAYPGTVEVRLFVGAPGGLRACLPGTRCGIKAARRLYADGAATVVFVDMKTQKSCRIPEEIRARLERAGVDA